jgi:hypothetical protein
MGLDGRHCRLLQRLDGLFGPACLTENPSESMCYPCSCPSFFPIADADSPTPGPVRVPQRDLECGRGSRQRLDPLLPSSYEFTRKKHIFYARPW